MRNLILMLSLFTLSTAAHASKEVIACGGDREEGYRSAEIAFVDDTEAAFSLHLKGEELSEEKFGFAFQDEGLLVTVFQEPERRDRVFRFNEQKKTVQEFLIEGDSERKVGKPKPCIFPAS